VVHAVFDELHLLGREHLLDLLQGGTVDRPDLIVLLFFTESGVFIYGLLFRRLVGKNRTDLVLLLGRELQVGGHGRQFLGHFRRNGR